MGDGMTDPFADVRDKRMNELNDEQQDRASELWCRANIDWMSDYNQPQYKAMFRIIDRLRAPQNDLTFNQFRVINVARCLRWHPQGIESWSASDWMTAIMGELGEVASLIKMRNRERDGLPGNKFSPTSKQIADEVADVFAYLDLFAACKGIDLGRAVAEKFNEVSERLDFPERITIDDRFQQGG